MKRFFLSAGLTFCLFANVQASPTTPCVVNELEHEMINAELAMSIGQCHLASAQKPSANQPDATVQDPLPALEYARSWFALAQRLGANDISQYLSRIDTMLSAIAQGGEQ